MERSVVKLITYCNFATSVIRSISRLTRYFFDLISHPSIRGAFRIPGVSSNGIHATWIDVYSISVIIDLRHLSMIYEVLYEYSWFSAKQ
jgi:hypothetical protein